MNVPQFKNVVRIESIQVGRAKPFSPNNHVSAIDKRPLFGPVNVLSTCLEGDEQADKKHHGGPDMAVHHYPLDHYEAWKKENPLQAHLCSSAISTKWEPPAFRSPRPDSPAGS